jgi:hypothetical protein
MFITVTMHQPELFKHRTSSHIAPPLKSAVLTATV